MRKLSLKIVCMGLMIISACQSAPVVAPTQTATVALTIPPTTTAMPSPVPTSTRDPNLPCGGIMPERVYLFLDCNDVRLIRAQIDLGNEPASTAWVLLKAKVDAYLQRFPVTYDPDDDTGKLWEGSHGNYHARDMALIYLVSGEEKYADGVIQLLDVVKRGTPYNDHMTPLASSEEPGVGSGGLLAHFAYGELPVQSVLFSYLAIRDEGFLTSEQIAEYDAFFKHQAVIAEEVAAELGNRIPLDSWVNRNTPMGANISAATLSIAFSDDPDMLALHERVRKKMEWQLGNWFETDGNWGEDVDGYGYRILEGLLHYAEAAQMIRGEDLYKLDFNGRNLHLFCEWFLKDVTPIGRTPALNDTPHSYGDPGVFKLCAFRTGDPALNFLFEKYMKVWISDYTPFNILTWSGLYSETAEPSFTSLSMPDVGITIFRDGWDRDSQYLLLQFTDSLVHAEKSFGNIYLFDHGSWMVGNGYHSPGESQAGQPTDQHSTLALNFRDQDNIGGELLAFADLSQTGISSISARSYDTMRHTRTVMWIKPWSHWLVVDDAKVDGGGKNQLQLRWYVRGARQEAGRGKWRFTRQGSGMLEIQVLTNLAVEYSNISREYDWEWDLDNAVGVLANLIYPGKPVRIVSSLNPDLNADPASTVMRLDSDQGAEIVVQREYTEWTWILPQQFTDIGVIGESQIEGKAGCQIVAARELQGYCLMLGTNLVMRGQSLVQADAPVYVEVDLAAGTIVILSESNAIISLYSPYEVNVVLQDGHPIALMKMGTTFTINVIAGRNEFTIQK